MFYRRENRGAGRLTCSDSLPCKWLRPLAGSLSEEQDLLVRWMWGPKEGAE